MDENVNLGNVGDAGGSGAPDTGGVSNVTNTASNIRDFSENDLVRVPGMAEPVKYGDLHKRLQADYTKKTTEAARMRQQLEKERQEWQSSRAKEEENLKRLATELLAQSRGQGGGQGNDLYAKLEGMNYLDGKTAAQLFKDLQENGVGSIKTQLQERDNVIRALYSQVVQLNNTVNGLQGNYKNNSFESLIDRTLKEKGLPPEAKDFAKEVYLAYEGDDLDDEFPTILENRWNQLTGLFNASQKARVEAAKKKPFPIPGRGGNGTAGKPLDMLKGHESAKKTTDVLWDMIQASGDSD